MPHHATRDLGARGRIVIREGLTRQSGGSFVHDLRSAMRHLEVDPLNWSMQRSGYHH